MDENQRINEETVMIREEETFCRKHPFLKCLLSCLMVFLGAFCAFYVVTDWHYKAMMRMKHSAPFDKQMEKFAKQEMKNYEALMGHNGKKFKKTGNIIHMQNTGREYRIIIDLRAFDNNENNLHVTSSGNVLTIVGRTMKKSKFEEQISEFQQSYMFGENVKLDNMTKESNGDYYVITIPIQKSDDDE